MVTYAQEFQLSIFSAATLPLIVIQNAKKNSLPKLSPLSLQPQNFLIFLPTKNCLLFYFFENGIKCWKCVRFFMIPYHLSLKVLSYNLIYLYLRHIPVLVPNPLFKTLKTYKNFLLKLMSLPCVLGKKGT